MSRFVLVSRYLATPDEILEGAHLVVEDNRVALVGRGSPPSGHGPLVDVGDALVAPGFIDLHVHGGGGYEVNCATKEEVELSVEKMAHFHAGHGTTSMLPTTVSDSPEALRVAVEGVAAASAAEEN